MMMMMILKIELTFCGVLMFLMSLSMSSLARSAPNPEVRSRPSPTQTTLLSFIPAWLAVSWTGPADVLDVESS